MQVHLHIIHSFLGFLFSLLIFLKYEFLKELGFFLIISYLIYECVKSQDIKKMKNEVFSFSIGMIFSYLFYILIQ
jgi:hypothetical protein